MTQKTRKPLVSQIGVVLGVIVVLLLAGLIIWGVLALANNFAPQIEAIRDILIIALALESCLFGVALVLLLVMVIRLVNMLEFEIKPILEKTNETVGMVRGTTTFVSENVVKPVTKANSYMVATRRAMKALFGDPRKNLPD
ncbi:MAG: hypothetical protein H6662_03525 [Ardenticatenaceae bacterium]|nr:hypothetical protein [Anaerolineales bacterium]MCB8920632.1 hypothetical protein [Ardenticatenaceae bacterium]MCB8990256.1 hypothetical protein [Ardenticatenaceae bacterium]MCB9002952.1 hypothetical protein [Ardenticatenaceae bacterium]